MMSNFFDRENMIERVIAFLIACALWMYVMNDQNPLVERNYVVNLELRNVPDEMIVLNVPDKVRVKVQAQRTVLGDMSDKEVTAYVDFADKNIGQQTLPVKAQFSQGTVLEVYPNNVYAYLDSVSEKVMDVDTRVIGIPASDFTLSKREVIPANVTVKGATHRINEMARVVAPVDVSERENDFQVESTLIAMNKSGLEMPDLQITPAKAQVKATLVRQMITVELPVVVETTGTLAGGMNMKRAVSEPATVKLTAEPSILQNLTEVRTQPVDLTKFSINGNVEAILLLPEKTMADTHTVKVHIEAE
ncbi:CdaR family protein [Phascolarctobacterium sp.]|uniref:CdaR family protein n=1 Tax=Phascolarctobacterium sp. TaxID=2049039 RepID=UPI003025375E